MAKDPVCGMEVDENNAKHTIVQNGETYYFCCPICQEEFETRSAKIEDRAERK